jgi:hypothetical protein
MTDQLRRAVDALDRSRARRHALTQELVLPTRGDAVARQVCRQCGHRLDAFSEYVKWRDDNGGSYYVRTPAGGWIRGGPDLSRCRCGGEWVEVVW